MADRARPNVLLSFSAGISNAIGNSPALMRGKSSGERTGRRKRDRAALISRWPPSRFNSTVDPSGRSEEHTSELQSLMRISYAVFCLKNKTHKSIDNIQETNTNIENKY